MSEEAIAAPIAVFAMHPKCHLNICLSTFYKLEGASSRVEGSNGPPCSLGREGGYLPALGGATPKAVAWSFTGQRYLGVPLCLLVLFALFSP